MSSIRARQSHRDGMRTLCSYRSVTDASRHWLDIAQSVPARTDHSDDPGLFFFRWLVVLLAHARAQGPMTSLTMKMVMIMDAVAPAVRVVLR